MYKYQTRHFKSYIQTWAGLAAVMLLTVLSVFMPVSVYGASSDRVVDSADLFSDSEIQAINQKASELSEKWNTDVFVITDFQNGYSYNYARDYLEEYGEKNYPDGYIGYMINMADRSYWVDAYGSDEREIFTQDKTDRLSELASEQLREGNYGQSALDVLHEIGNQYELAQPMGWLKKPFLYPMKTLLLLAGSCLGGLAAAAIATGMKMASHKDKGIARSASQYGSGFTLDASRNQFVRHYQTRMPKPKPQSSSGGGGFSGGGGSAGHTGSGGHF